MRNVLWAGALASIASAASAQSRPPSAGDTLRLGRAAAIATAISANLQVEVAKQQAAQARAQLVQAVAIPEPSLGASFDGQSGPLNTGSATGRNVNVGVAIPFPDKFRLKGAIGASNVRALDAQTRMVQQQIASQAARSYDSVLVTRMHRRDLLEARELAADFLAKTKARFDAGTTARLDVIKATVLLAQADNDLIANSRDVKNAEAALNRVIGRPLGAPIIALDSLEAPPPPSPLEEAEQLAMQRRPEITTAEEQLRGASATSRLARESAFVPDFSISANHDYAADAGTLYSLGLSLPLSIFFWQHTRGEFAETHHRELELQAVLRDTRAAVGQDVRAAWTAADVSVRQALFIRDQLLPSAREAFRVATTSYSLGRLSALDVLDARSTLLDAQRQYADALAAANSARADLDRATGAPLGAPTATTSGARP
jgi:cobalt-zinc-cadmium efflux system outer membrane protein